jgi:hypothetical protein
MATVLAEQSKDAAAASSPSGLSGEHFIALTEQAQSDLALMLEYLTKTNLGGTLDRQKVAEAARLCAVDIRTLSDEERTRVWTLVDEFSPLMKSMTIEDLRVAQKPAMLVSVGPWLRSSILAAFIITLSLQFWVMMGTKAIDGLESVERKRMEMIDVINTMENANPELAKARDHDQRIALNAEYSQMRDRYDAVVTQQCYAYHGLYQLNSVWATAVAWINLSSPIAYWGYEGACGASAPNCQWRDSTLECAPGERSQVQVRYGTEVMARVTIDALSSLVLPSLFAMLGACMRVLRDRLQQYRDRRIEQMQPWETRVRILLGTVVGSVLGFFYSPQFIGGQLAAIPLLGLAFLAGYNVDLLFMLFDKFTQWLRGKAGGAEANERSGS